jgi:hypothetical protein
MDRINNIVLAVFFTWLAAMIVTELHAHHVTQPVEVRR